MIFNYDISDLQSALTSVEGDVSDLETAISDEHSRVTYAFEVSAYYEPTTTASLRDYYIGDYVIVNDRLWKLTDNVTNGSSFVGKITRVVLGNEVETALNNVAAASTAATTALEKTTYAFEVSAYYEPGTTATLRSYSVDDYVIVNDRLWKVTDSVPLGSSLNGHITRVVLGNEVKSALSTANTALSTANTALSTANTASTNATTALTETTPIARGGTGATSVADAKVNFGIANLTLSTKAIPKNETTTISISKNARGLLVIPESGLYGVSSSSQGVCSVKTISSISNVSLTPGTYQIEVRNNSTANFNAYYLDFENVSIS